MKQRFLVQELPRNIPDDDTALYALIGGTWFFLCRKSWGDWWKNDSCAVLLANTPRLSKAEMSNTLSFTRRVRNIKPKRPYILEFDL